MKRAVLGLAVSLGLASLGGCYVYDPYYHTPQTVMRPASFDKSFNAAQGAMADEGVKIHVADRERGIIEGTRRGIEVKARVHSQQDGAVRVEFNATGDLDADRGLADRVSRAYDYRMGR